MSTVKSQNEHGDTSRIPPCPQKRATLTRPPYSNFQNGKRRLKWTISTAATSQAQDRCSATVLCWERLFCRSKSKEPITRRFFSCCYRLCVYASGSLITVILNFVTFISDTCLHFGQNRGNFFNSVLYLICTLVLFPQTGQRINCTSCMS